MNKRYPYKAWKLLVDKNLERMCGMDSEWLPDADYTRWYEEGKTPLMAAKLALKNAKEY